MNGVDFFDLVRVPEGSQLLKHWTKPRSRYAVFLLVQHPNGKGYVYRVHLPVPRSAQRIP